MLMETGLREIRFTFDQLHCIFLDQETIWMLCLVVNSNEKRVIDDAVLSEKLGIHLQNVEDSLLVFLTYLNLLLLPLKVKVFKSDGSLSVDPTGFFDCFSPLS